MNGCAGLAPGLPVDLDGHHLRSVFGQCPVNGCGGLAPGLPRPGHQQPPAGQRPGRQRQRLPGDPVPPPVDRVLLPPAAPPRRQHRQRRLQRLPPAVHQPSVSASAGRSSRSTARQNSASAPSAPGSAADDGAGQVGPVPLPLEGVRRQVHPPGAGAGEHRRPVHPPAPRPHPPDRGEQRSTSGRPDRSTGANTRRRRRRRARSPSRPPTAPRPDRARGTCRTPSACRQPTPSANRTVSRTCRTQ